MVRVRPSVFREEFWNLEVEPLLTVSEILGRVGVVVPEGHGAVVWIHGRKVPPEWHGRMRPKPRAIVNIAVMPRDQRTALLIGGALILAVAAPLAGPAFAGAIGLTAGSTSALLVGAGVSAGIAIGGTLALNALIPPPDSGGREDGEAFERTSIGSASNRLDPYGIVPVVCGGRKVTPPMAARPYKSIIEGRLHSNFLFCISVGRVAIGEPKFGETSIFDFDGVTYQAWEGGPGDPSSTITLFQRDVADDLVNAQVTQADGPIVRAAADDATELKAIFHAPSGPYFLNSKSEARSATVVLRLEYRLQGSGTWLAWDEVHLSGGTAPGGFSKSVLAPQFWEFTKVVGAVGDYEVQVTRMTPDNDDPAKRNTDILWLSLQTTQSMPIGTPPLFPQDMAVVAIRVRDQGAMGAFNCLAVSYAPVFSGSVWQTTHQQTSNPASIFRRVLQSKAGYFTVPDDNLDLPALGAWFDYCSTNNLHFSGVLEQEQPVVQHLAAICSAGHATLDFVDGKYSVIIDQPSQLVATTILTPRNMADFQAEIDYEPIPQVLRVRFADGFNGFEPDERLVLDDGYNEATADFSTALVIDLVNSATNAELAWRHGRRWLAHRRLRRERITGTIGLEHVMLQRGQKVLWQHWASLVGLGEGRIIAQHTDGSGNIIGIHVDNLFRMEAGGGPYGVKIRSIVGANPQIIIREIAENPGRQSILAFTVTIPAGDGAFPGDLVAFGRLNAETSEMIVLDRSPTIENATIVLTHAAPGIEVADTGPIPPWSPNISVSARPVLAPATPTIISLTIESQSLVGHPDVLRRVSLVVQVAPQTGGGGRPLPMFHVVRLRTFGSGENWRMESFPGDGQVLKVAGIGDGITYEVQVQALGIARNGQALPSAWSAVRTVAVPRASSTPGTLARIRNLQLLGQANDQVFAGRSPTFTWTLSSGLGGVSFDQITGGVNSFVDPTFGYYEVIVYGLPSNTLRRVERTHEPSYTYAFTKNQEDSAKLNQVLPAAWLRVTVALVDTFQHRSESAIIDVINPAPDTPTGLRVDGGVGTVFVSITKPTDGDFAGIIVWASSTSGFAPQPATEVARTAGDIRASFNAAGPTFVRVAAYDEFRDDPSVLNISSEVLVTPLDPNDISAQPTFQFEGLVLIPHADTNTVTWDLGIAHITAANGTVVSEVINPGTLFYGGVRFYIYYQRGSGTLQGTLDITTATGIDRAVIAVYHGGNALADLLSTRMRYFAADIILAGTIGAGVLAVDHAIITQGAQIASAIINSAHIGFAQITEAHIQNAAITNAHIQNLSVDIFKIAGNAVDQHRLTSEAAVMSRSAFTTAGGTIPTNYGSTQSVTVVTRGGFVTVMFSCQIVPGALSTGIDARLLREGAVVVAEQNVLSLAANDGGTIVWTAVDLDPGPTDSFRTYTIQLRGDGNRNATHKAMQVVAYR